MMVRGAKVRDKTKQKKNKNKQKIIVGGMGGKVAEWTVQ